MTDISITLDGQALTVPAETTILQAARAAGRDIPTICYHEACTANGLCRMCLVEVEGSRLLTASCVAQVTHNMVIRTQSERITRSRRTILEMLQSTVNLSEAPGIQPLIDEYGANATRFPDATPRSSPMLDDNPMYVRDYSQCVLCWRCVQVCAEDAQYAFALTLGGRGYATTVATFFDAPLPQTTCVFCGQCVGVCPTGALKPRREYLLQQGLTPDEVIATTRSNRRRAKRRQP